jgi:hypothetical protein
MIAAIAVQTPSEMGAAMNGTRRHRLRTRGVVTLALLAIASTASAQELTVIPGEQPGVYTIETPDGLAAELSLVVDGPPLPEDFRVDDCRFGESFDLVATLRGPNIEKDTLRVPLEFPSEISGVRVVASESGFMVAVDLTYWCSSHYGEMSESRWIAFEAGPTPTLLLNSKTHYGGRCNQGDQRQPSIHLSPHWMIQDDRLWMKLDTESAMCWSSARERRGSVSWEIGSQPIPVEHQFSKGLLGLLPKVHAMGYQPYAQFEIGRRMQATIAEVPSNMGASRLLSVVDRRGRQGMVLLGQFGYHVGLSGKPVDEDTGLPQLRGASIQRIHEWPSLSRVEAFSYSNDFLIGRQGLIVRKLLGSRNVSIVEFSIPCVSAVDPAPNGAATERWLLRAERTDQAVDLEAYLIESCSLGYFGTDLDTGLFVMPPAALDVSGNKVRLIYPNPRVDLDELAEEKLMFMYLEGLNEAFGLASVVMSLGSPTIENPRCEPAVPLSGRGWLTRSSGRCSIEISSLREMPVPNDQSPLSFVEAPSIEQWCRFASGSNAAGWARIRVQPDGSAEVTDYRSGEPIPRQVVEEVSSWLIEPARDAQGQPMAVDLAVELYFGKPVWTRPPECRNQ